MEEQAEMLVARGLHVTLPRMKKAIRFPVCLAVCTLLTVACSPVRQIRPLDKGESRVSLSAGGPITQVGKIYIPLPLISLGYNYGLMENLDVEAGIHVTDMLYGVLKVDAGVNWRPLVPPLYSPGIIISPRLFGMTDFSPGSSRLYPELGLTGYWDFKKYRYAYIGIDNWIEYHTTRVDGNPQTNHWLIAPYAGVSLGNRLWQGQLEVMVYTPNLSNQGRPVKNIGFGKYGIIGVFLGVSRSFGGSRE